MTCTRSGTVGDTDTPSAASPFGLSAFIERLDASVVIVDAHRRVRYANPASERMTGVEPAAIINRRIDAPSAPAMPHFPLSAVEECLARGGSMSFEYHDALAGAPLSAHVAAIPDGAGIMTSGTGQGVPATHDSTPVYDTRARDHEEVVTANEEKASWLSRMNHELLTPLHGLLGFSELLASDPENRLSAQQTEELRQIQNAGQRLLRLIKDGLELARADSARIELRNEEVDLRLLIDEVCLMARPAAEKKKVHLRADCDHALECVRGDAGRLRQVIANLVSNAIKYSHADGGEVVVEGIAWQARGVEIRVSDTGIGIHEDQQTTIFEPFERGRNADARASGYGIGLSVVKRLVELMGGQITVCSEPERGSTFVVVLPLDCTRTTNPEAEGQETTDE